jgi:hypothetical protein
MASIVMEAIVIVRSLDENMPIKKSIINMKLRKRVFSRSLSIKTGNIKMVKSNMTRREMNEMSDSQ